MFSTLVAIGIIILQIFTVLITIGLITKNPIIKKYSYLSDIVIKVSFVLSILGSLIYSNILGFPPCLLCWYQRIFIFSEGIILFTANITKSKLLRIQSLLLMGIGAGFALFHNIIDWFPGSASVCGTSGPSCTIRFVYEFGYITIPMMSLTILTFGIVLILVAWIYPQESIA